MVGKSGSVKLSRVLNKEENEAVVQMFDHKCQVEAAAVVQLYMTEPPNNNSWIKECAGVATLTRDGARRGYFLQVVDIEAALVLFEQEVYREFEYHSDVPFFHQFEGEDRMVGLNFADDKDATNFQTSVKNLLRNRQKKREERQARLMREEEDKHKQRRQKEQQKHQKLQQQQQLKQQEEQKQEVAKAMKGGKFTMRKKKVKKIRKNMVISDPFNFQHVSHAGFDNNFNVDEELMGLFEVLGMENRKDAEKEFVLSYLKESGRLEEAKKESRRYTMRRHEQEGEKYRSPQPPTAPVPPAPPARSLAPPPPPPTERRPSQSRSRTSSNSSSTSSLPPPPPPPSLHQTQYGGKNGVLPPTPPPPSRFASSSLSSSPDYSSYSIPPPPPPHQTHPPPPSSSHKSHAPPPPPPPLPSSGGPPPPPPPPPLPSSSGPPPPPPPPPPSGGMSHPSAPPPPVDTRGAFLEEIRNTGSRGLKKGPPPLPPSSSSSSSSGGMNQLLEDIRSGRKLHHVETPEPGEKKEGPVLDGLALDLHRALQERSQFIHSSDDDDDDDEDTDDDEWDD